MPFQAWWLINIHCRQAVFTILTTALNNLTDCAFVRKSRVFSIIIIIIIIIKTANGFIPGASVLQYKTGQYNTVQYNTIKYKSTHHTE